MEKLITCSTVLYDKMKEIKSLPNKIIILKTN